MANLEDALHTISPKDGDIVFFDMGAIDTSEMQQLCANPPSYLVGVVFIGIALRHGESAEDAVFHMSKAELELLISEK